MAFVTFSDRSPIIISTAKMVKYAARTMTTPDQPLHTAAIMSIVHAERAAGTVKAFFLMVINATAAARITLDEIAI